MTHGLLTSKQAGEPTLVIKHILYQHVNA